MFVVLAFLFLYSLLMHARTTPAAQQQPASALVRYDSTQEIQRALKASEGLVRRAALTPEHPEGDVLTVTITAYNSLPSQTWGDPHITATGTRTRVGVVAASRDLINSGVLPYGSEVMIKHVEHNPRGCTPSESLHSEFFNIPLVVEDTMHARKTQQIDIWMPHLEQAQQWGYCQGEIVIINNSS